jgi:hypothetical protein
MSAFSTMEKKAGGLIAMLVRTDTTIAEFWSSTLLIAWSLFFAFPISRPRSEVMQDLVDMMGPVGGRWTLAAICLGLGAAQALANFNRHRKWRRKLAFGCSVFYGFISILTFYALAGAILVYTAAVCSLVSGVIYLRLSLELMDRPWVDAE